VIDTLTRAQPRQDLGLLFEAVRRNQHRDGLAHRLVRRVAENAGGALVPRDDHALERLADDRIVGRRHDGRETASQFFRVSIRGGQAIH